MGTILHCEGALCKWAKSFLSPNVGIFPQSKKGFGLIAIRKNRSQLAVSNAKDLLTLKERKIS
jgi:hypothetical protein